MNRYTYKAKRKDNGEWVYGYYTFHKYSNSHYIIGENFMDIEIEIIPETLCQCTGLKDIDGNYIFENDILEMNDPILETGTVVWDEYDLRFKVISDTDRPHIDGGFGLLFDIGSKKGQETVCRLQKCEYKEFLPKIIGNKFDKEGDN